MSIDGLTSYFPLTINGLQDISANSSTVDTLQVNSLTPNRAVVSNGSNFLISAGATSTEIDYLSGTTSNIQTQINSKATTSYVDTNFLNKVTATQQDVTAFCNFTSGVGSTTIGMSNGLQWYKNSAFQNSWSIVRQLGSGSILKDLVFRDNENSVDTLLLSEDGQKVYVGLTCDYTTASKIPIFDSSKKLVSSGVDSIKITYLDNVSSDIQTQLNSKLNLSGGTMTGTITMGSYKVTSSAIPVIGDDYTNKTYVDTAITGLSSVYAKLAGPQTFTGTHTFSSATPIILSGLTSNRVLQLNGSNNVQSSTVTTTELGYVSGVTSAIQTQLNTLSGTFANYLPLTGGTLSGTLTVEGASGISLTNVATTNGVLSTRYYIGARGDNQDDVGADNKYGPWYGLGASGIAGFINVPCLAGWAGVALRTSSGVLVMKDDGAVGIGATDIIGRFNIAHSDAADFFTLQNTTRSSGQFINQRFMFGNKTTNSNAYIQARLNVGLDTDLAFYVDGGSGVSERFRIRGDGKIVATASVGIGTTTIDTELYVYGKGKFYNATIGVPANGINGGTGTRLILWPGDATNCPYGLGIDGGTLWYGTPATASHKWYDGTTLRMILTGGNVGIGTTNPTGRLMIYDTTSDYTNNVVLKQPWPGLLLDNTHMGGREWGIFNGGSGAGIGQGNFGIYDKTANAYRLCINSLGDVGIGTQSPQGDLHISLSGAVNDYWGKFIVKTTSFWGDGCSTRSETAGTQYGTVYPMMYMAPHIVSDTDGWCAIRMGRAGGVATGRWWEIANRSDGVFQIGVERSSQFTILPAGDVTIAARLTVGGVNDPNGTFTVRNPNGTNTHFGYSDNFNYIRGDTWMNGVFRCSQTSYWSDWLRISNNNPGIWWEGLGRGIISPEAEGNPYGTINTHGSGRNGWSGYGINSRWCFMSNGLENCGLHDNVNSWALQQKGTVGLFLNRIARASAAEYDRFIIWRIAEDDYGNGYWYFNVNGGSGYTSDERIKKDIAPLSTQQSIAFIKHLQPTTFRMKDTEPCVRTNPDGTETVEEAKGCNCFLQDGFIAQNILEACELTGVSKSVLNNWYGYEEMMKKPEEERKLDKDNVLGVGDRPILSHTVNAVKGLMEQLDVLTERNQVLETRLQKLENLLKINGML